MNKRKELFILILLPFCVSLKKDSYKIKHLTVSFFLIFCWVRGHWILSCVHQWRSFVCCRKMDHRRKRGRMGREGRNKKYKRRKLFETVGARGEWREKGKLYLAVFHDRHRQDKVSSGCTGGSGIQHNKNRNRTIKWTKQGYQLSAWIDFKCSLSAYVCGYRNAGHVLIRRTFLGLHIRQCKSVLCECIPVCP